MTIGDLKKKAREDLGPSELQDVAPYLRKRLKPRPVSGYVLKK